VIGGVAGVSPAEGAYNKHHPHLSVNNIPQTVKNVKREVSFPVFFIKKKENFSDPKK
jgi:hypothetical protein